MHAHAQMDDHHACRWAYRHDCRKEDATQQTLSFQGKQLKAEEDYEEPWTEHNHMSANPLVQLGESGHGRCARLNSTAHPALLAVDGSQLPSTPFFSLWCMQSM